MLFLGTSMTNNGFSTSVFEQAMPVPTSSFNMGLPASRYNNHLEILDYIVGHYGKPKLTLKEDAHYTTDLAQPLLSWPERLETVFSSFSSLYRYRDCVNPLVVQKRSRIKSRPG